MRATAPGCRIPSIQYHNGRHLSSLYWPPQKPAIKGLELGDLIVQLSQVFHYLFLALEVGAAEVLQRKNEVVGDSLGDGRTDEGLFIHGESEAAKERIEGGVLEALCHGLLPPAALTWHGWVLGERGRFVSGEPDTAWTERRGPCIGRPVGPVGPPSWEHTLGRRVRRLGTMLGPDGVLPRKGSSLIQRLSRS